MSLSFLWLLFPWSSLDVLFPLFAFLFCLFRLHWQDCCIFVVNLFVFIRRVSLSISPFLKSRCNLAFFEVEIIHWSFYWHNDFPFSGVLSAATVIAATILVHFCWIFSGIAVFVADFLFLFWIVCIYLCYIKFRRLCEMYA